MSPQSLRRCSPVLLMGVLLFTVAGCVDYTNRFDTVSIHSGDASRANVAIQTVDPWPPESERTFIDANGRKVKQAIDDYTTPKTAGTTAGTTNITINN